MSESRPDIGVPHYRVLSPLGAGGMGEVWLAEDTRLGRRVAIKLLPAEATRNPESVRRFMQEARAASALNHPHIVTVHDIGSSQAGHFIVMELVSGATLRTLLGQERNLSSMLDWFAQIARAIAAAHAAGITHRDLKPENIMLRDDGYIKVLDFGLARLGASASTEDEATAQHTSPGQVMGTMRYMSPEQASGEPAGPGSDIFSMGLVFYELASGRYPFKAQTLAGYMHAITTQTPAPIEDVHSGLRSLILRMLEKAPADRPSATEVVRALESIGSAPVIAPPVSGFAGRPAIAVIPFDNLSSDPEQQYFADGLADELITRLSMWRSFPVIARSSSFAFRGKVSDPKIIAADLGVRYLVQGSVRKSGPRVRIAAQLVEATTAQQVWAKTFDRELTDVFAVQDELSESIAASIVSDLHRVEYASAQKRPPESLEAWGLYQRALPLIQTFTREDAAEARRLLERSVALDPSFAPPLARLAELSIWEVIFSWTDQPDEVFMKGLEQAQRAVMIDPADADSHAFLSWMLLTVGEAEKALEIAKRAVELNPSSIWALNTHAWVWTMTGRDPAVSIAEVERAMRLSPHDAAEFLFHDIGSASYLNAGRYEEGLTFARRLIALRPKYYWGHLWAAANSVGVGRLDEAREYVAEARAIQPEISIALIRQGLGAMAPEVDARLTGFLAQAGLP